jgi:UDP-3-O-[3-hydroxymyristoyl] glucosamine N-acyltransferase
MLFDRNQFHPLKNKINNSIIKTLLNNHVVDHKLFDDKEITKFCSLNNLNDNSILFVDIKNTSSFKTNDKSNLILFTNDKDFFSDVDKINIFLIDDIDKSFLILANFMFHHEDQIDFEDEFNLINNSYISKYASVHKTSKIYNNCVIGRGVQIGKNCIIKNNVVIKNAIIKDNVLIGDNTSIGTSGFGFNLNNLGAKNLLPQIGIVVIDENV